MSQRPLAYDPSLFLELAEQLLSDRKYEEIGRSRTAIGRAYYAAFLLVKKKLEAVGGSFRNAHRIHEEVITTVNEKNSNIGNKLETLRRYRVDADYKMHAEVNVSVGLKCVRVSRSVLSLIEQIR